jgi:hypothetical protein
MTRRPSNRSRFQRSGTATALAGVVVIISGTLGIFGLFGSTEPKASPRSYAATGDMDCTDFSSQDEAQAFFEDEGGPDEDYHNLDRDGDGVVCETLP